MTSNSRTVRVCCFSLLFKLRLFAYLIPPHDRVNLLLGILLCTTVLWTCFDTCRQEVKSDRFMKKFYRLIPEAATIIRDGEHISINIEDLVIGDILLIKNGEKIPADCRILSSFDLLVDMGILTGENEIISCTVNPLSEDPLEAKNLVFKGSLVLSGTGVAVVIRTGDNTLIGTVANISSTVQKANTTLRSEVEDVVRKISKVAVCMALLVFIVGVGRGLPVLLTFIRGFVGMIPCE